MGWKLAGAQSAYIQMRADKHGDCVIGRIFAGLPVNTPDFGVLPPHFPVVDERVTDALSLCFPAAPARLRPVLELCLASLIHHREFLRQTLDAKHPLFRTPVFADGSIVTNLERRVVCRLFQAGDRFQPTGLPVLTVVLTEVQGIKDSVASVLPKLEKLIDGIPAAVGAEVRQIMEDNAYAAGNVSRSVMEVAVADTVKSAIEATGIRAMVDHWRSGELPGARQPALVADERGPEPYSLFMWQGSFHSVPEDFKLPNTGLLAAFQAFMCPNAEFRHPAIRRLLPTDMSTLDKRKRFSDFKVCCEIIAKKVNSHNDLQRIVLTL